MPTSKYDSHVFFILDKTSSICQGRLFQHSLFILKNNSKPSFSYNDDFTALKNHIFIYPMKTSFDHLIISNVFSKQRKETMLGLIYVKRTKDLFVDFVFISEARVA